MIGEPTDNLEHAAAERLDDVNDRVWTLGQ
jgi:hypothetical protein